MPIESSAEIGPRKVGSAAANEAETASPRAETSIANQSATTTDSTESVVEPVSARGTTPLPVQTAALAGPKLGSEEATPSSGPSVQAPSAGAFLAMSEPGHVAYRIGPLDVLTVSVFRVPELSATVQVADTGTINLPLIGEVPASGRTAQEVEQDLTARLGEKYLQNPQVNVFIKEYNARRVTVDGSVKKPGVFPLRGRTSLLQVITMAEGLDHNRASSNVVVFRQVDGKRMAARFDLDDIRAGTANDPLMEPGDVVIVDDNAAKIVLHNFLRVLPVTNFFLGVL